MTIRAVLAAAVVLPAAPASASVDDTSALAAYVRARAADSSGATEQAARNYGAALALAPQNEVLAARALSQAIAAGDRALALQAARLLDSADKLAPDGRLLLVGEAFRTKQWKEAGRQIERLEQDEVFSFMTPLLRAWLAQGSGKGKPLTLLDGASGNALAATYASEHRPLLLLAGGQAREGALALAPLLEDESIRSQRLRIAAAAMLARKGGQKEALAILQGDAEALVEARRRIEAGKRLGGEIVMPAAGMAELLGRMALDLNGQEVPQLALSFARLATFLAPENAESWLIAADLLTGQGRHEAALAALARIPRDDVFAATVAERRMTVLVDADRTGEALAEAKQAVADRPAEIDSWTRLGDILNQTKRHSEAAAAYAKALDLVKAGAESHNPLWALWLLRGSALTQAGDWAAGKAALEEARKLAPNQPVVLNFLGYSQLERRENLAEAEKLIGEANRLQPGDAAITDSLGWAHYVRGDVPKAIELLEQAAQGQPTDAAIAEHLGDAYYSAGRRYEARYAWRAALHHAEGPAADRLRSKIDTGLRPDLTAP
ncbi:MAG TPA: tetratricopeptide repeat protein [Allosphingosinicella sp.]|nr:tetratricopeptide repeat protein [Allosphingosinicella sp.]